MCLTNTHMRVFFFQCNLFSQNQQKTEKKIFGLKKMNLLEWLQNLKQHSTPIGAFCGKKFDHESQPFYRYGFPPVTQFFDSRTVYTPKRMLPYMKQKILLGFFLEMAQNSIFYQKNDKECNNSQKKLSFGFFVIFYKTIQAL